ncbi:MAG: hypothetical protein ACKOPO_03775, partial [Novosphingobium sp.]
MIGTWDRERIAKPSDSHINLTHTNDEVRELNLAARKAESQSLKNAESNFVSITRELTGFVE